MIYDTETGEHWPYHNWNHHCLAACKPTPQKIEPELTLLLEAGGIAEALLAAADGLTTLDQHGP